MCDVNPSKVVSFDEYPGEAEVEDIRSKSGSSMRCNTYLFPRGTFKQELVLPFIHMYLLAEIQYVPQLT